MAKRKKQPQIGHRRKPRERAAVDTSTHTTRRSSRPEERTFPELGNLKDKPLMGHAKTYADEMFQSEEALGRAAVAKQAIRTRMGRIDAAHFTGHGYEFARTPGEETFSARKVKRGAKPADTAAEPLEEEVEPDELEEPDDELGAGGEDEG